METLKKIKEELKNKVVSSEIDWRQRMEIYSEIQKINRQIEEKIKEGNSIK